MELVIAPAGRRVQLAPGTSILQALVAAQVPVSYSCMAGRCGTCRYRLLEGTVLEEQPGGGERLVPEGSASLACRGRPQGSCRIEIPEPDEIVCHPARTLKGTVTLNAGLTHDIRRLRVQLNKPLAFSPGQYVNLQFAGEPARPYSMADVDGQELEFHVRVVPGGRLSNFIADQVGSGDQLRVSGPLGAAYLRRQHTGPMLFVVGGTGLAPALSMLRAAVAAGMPNPIRVYFGARTAQDLYGLDWLRSLQAQHPDMQVHAVVAQGCATQGRSGLVPDALAEDLAGRSDLQRWKAYLCGSPGLVEAASRLLAAMGLDEGQLHADAFYPVPHVATEATA